MRWLAGEKCVLRCVLCRYWGVGGLHLLAVADTPHIKRRLFGRVVCWGTSWVHTAVGQDVVGWFGCELLWHLRGVGGPTGKKRGGDRAAGDVPSQEPAVAMQRFCDTYFPRAVAASNMKSQEAGAGQRVCGGKGGARVFGCCLYTPILILMSSFVACSVPVSGARKAPNIFVLSSTVKGEWVGCLCITVYVVAVQIRSGQVS